MQATLTFFFRFFFVLCDLCSKATCSGTQQEMSPSTNPDFFTLILDKLQKPNVLTDCLVIQEGFSWVLFGHGKVGKPALKIFDDGHDIRQEGGI